MLEESEGAKPVTAAGTSDNVVRFIPAGKNNAPPIVSFDRRELGQLLQLYSTMVGNGEWRDYAIDMLRDRAVFSVFRRTAEVPLHTIEKNPKNARRQGVWSVTGADGRILKRGHDLATVLKAIDKPRRLRLV